MHKVSNKSKRVCLCVCVFVVAFACACARAFAFAVYLCACVRARATVHACASPRVSVFALVLCVCMCVCSKTAFGNIIKIAAIRCVTNSPAIRSHRHRHPQRQVQVQFEWIHYTLKEFTRINSDFTFLALPFVSFLPVCVFIYFSHVLIRCRRRRRRRRRRRQPCLGFAGGFSSVCPLYLPF